MTTTVENSSSSTAADAALMNTNVVAVVAPAAPKPESALKSFLAGGVGGAAIVLVGHPLDLVKVRMQTAAATGATAPPTVVSMLRQTFVKEGIRGLYRGASSPLVSASFIFATCFWGYDMGQRIVRWAQPDSGPDLSIAQKCFAGGFSAIPATAVMAPSERIKVLLQTDSKYKGMIDTGVKVFREGGIRSLYKGTFATLLRDVPGSVAWFGIYEFVKLEISKAQGIEDPKHLSPVAVVCAGGLAGMANWIVSIPPDVLKSRYQSAPPGQYASLLDVYRHLMRTEGPGALFAGIRPALMRAFPANAACFLAMEVARKVLGFMD